MFDARIPFEKWNDLPQRCEVLGLGAAESLGHDITSSRKNYVVSRTIVLL